MKKFKIKHTKDTKHTKDIKGDGCQCNENDKPLNKETPSIEVVIIQENRLKAITILANTVETLAKALDQTPQITVKNCFFIPSGDKAALNFATANKTTETRELLTESQMRNLYNGDAKKI